MVLAPADCFRDHAPHCGGPICGSVPALQPARCCSPRHPEMVVHPSVGCGNRPGWEGVVDSQRVRSLSYNCLALKS